MKSYWFSFLTSLAFIILLSPSEGAPLQLGTNTMSNVSIEWQIYSPGSADAIPTAVGATGSQYTFVYLVNAVASTSGQPITSFMFNYGSGSGSDVFTNSAIGLTVGPGNLPVGYNVATSGTSGSQAIFNFAGTAGGGILNGFTSDYLVILSDSGSYDLTGGTGVAFDSGLGAVVFGGIPAPSAVPEPSTWALLLAGISLTGLAAYRRRQSLL